MQVCLCSDPFPHFLGQIYKQQMSRPQQLSAIRYETDMVPEDYPCAAPLPLSPT